MRSVVLGFSAAMAVLFVVSVYRSDFYSEGEDLGRHIIDVWYFGFGVMALILMACVLGVALVTARRAGAWLGPGALLAALLNVALYLFVFLAFNSVFLRMQAPLVAEDRSGIWMDPQSYILLPAYLIAAWLFARAIANELVKARSQPGSIS